jgi:hypothetical protein
MITNFTATNPGQRKVFDCVNIIESMNKAVMVRIIDNLGFNLDVNKLVKLDCRSERSLFIVDV